MTAIWRKSAIIEPRGRRGSAKRRKEALDHDLDSLAGCWTSEEAAAFEESLRQQRAVERWSTACAS